MIDITVPVYDGCGIDVIFDYSGCVCLDRQNDTLVISGNNTGLYCLAKQLLYFFLNPIPNGTHIHYDEPSLSKGTWNGLTFVLEKSGDTKEQDFLLEGDVLHLAINPDTRFSADGCHAHALYSDSMFVLSVNALASRFLAYELLRFCTRNESGTLLWSRNTLGAMWTGMQVLFQIIN